MPVMPVGVIFAYMQEAEHIGSSFLEACGDFGNAQQATRGLKRLGTNVRSGGKQCATQVQPETSKYTPADRGTFTLRGVVHVNNLNSSCYGTRLMDAVLSNSMQISAYSRLPVM